jgi:hypothetical protein
MQSHKRNLRSFAKQMEQRYPGFPRPLAPLPVKSVTAQTMGWIPLLSAFVFAAFAAFAIAAI